MRTPLTLAALLGAASAPAFAGNIEPVAPIPAPVPVIVDSAPLYDWTGGYAGLALGYADAETDGAAVLDGDGAIGGLRLGYDYDFGQFVLGGRLDWDAANVDLATATGVDVATIDEVARLGLRAGYDAGRLLPFLTAGYAYADTDAVGVNSSDGYFAGVGLEGFVTENVTVTGELLHHEFDDFDTPNLEAEATTATIAVNFRF